MNNKLSSTALALAIALGLTGCESSRYEPATGLPGAAPALPPVRPKLTEAEMLVRAAELPTAPTDGDGWRALFDGKSPAGWRVTEFQEGGRVEVSNGLLLFYKGDPFVGVNWTNEIPKVNYEVVLDAMSVSGGDFFCGLTFPVRDSFCSLIVGGWGGSVVGLSSLDGADASENETTQFITFEPGRWYRIRLRVTEHKIEAWIEQKKVVNVMITGRKVSLRIGEIMLSKPFGLASYSTSAAFRGIRIREVSEPASKD
ncbi:MAG: DUF1080 domain-containing protein [Verrucomicrobiota bacterium]